jgi:hypothetical protein
VNQVPVALLEKLGEDLLMRTVKQQLGSMNLQNETNHMLIEQKDKEICTLKTLVGDLTKQNEELQKKVAAFESESAVAPAAASAP